MTNVGNAAGPGWINQQKAMLGKAVGKTKPVAPTGSATKVDTAQNSIATAGKAPTAGNATKVDRPGASGTPAPAPGAAAGDAPAVPASKGLTFKDYAIGAGALGATAMGASALTRHSNNAQQQY